MLNSKGQEFVRENYKNSEIFYLNSSSEVKSTILSEKEYNLVLLKINNKEIELPDFCKFYVSSKTAKDSIMDKLLGKTPKNEPIAIESFQELKSLRALCNNNTTSFETTNVYCEPITIEILGQRKGKIVWPEENVSFVENDLVIQS